MPGCMAIIIGYLLSRLTKGIKSRQLRGHQDAVLVVLVWLSTIAICSVPFLLSGQYNIMQSLFESTSGFTTTGLSIVDVQSAPHIILLYRSLMQFLGGVGLVLVFTSVFSDRYGFRLYNAEGHNDRLMPNLIKSSRLILSIYFFYIILGVILYVLFGMSLFDAINHSIAAVSTGGFSTRTDSIGAFHSIGIEMVTIALMLLGSTNFFIHLHLLKGKIRNVFRHGETKFLLVTTIMVLPVLIVILVRSGYSLGSALRVGFFQYVTAITTTGFQTVPAFQGMVGIFLAFMILLMLIGAGIGSTGGGMKQYRVLMAVKTVFWNLRDNLYTPRRVASRFMNRAGTDYPVNQKEQADSVSFVFLYLFIFIVGTLIFVAYGNTLVDSMFEFASSLGTVGLSIGIIAYDAPNLILLTSIVGMIFGRLEIYVILYALAHTVSSLSRKEWRADRE
ncbi:MAG: potassium transporter TrkG [bacterium]